jgi:hypothetical protein
MNSQSTFIPNPVEYFSCHPEPFNTQGELCEGVSAVVLNTFTSFSVNSVKHLYSTEILRFAQNDIHTLMDLIL